MNVALPATADLELVTACERRIVNAWPAPTTLIVGDWVVRMANGYSGRANSASPLTPGADLSDAELDLIEGLYRREGLPPFVRITPLAGAALERRLVARGYGRVGASIGMVADLRPGRIDAAALVEHRPVASEDWIAAVSALQAPDKRNAAHLAAIVREVRMPASFASIAADGAPVALGMSVLERGMAEIGSIIVDERRRGQGLGRKLVSGLMAWARDGGARQAYLQVEETNVAAITLYDSLGFRPVYRYAGWRLPD